MAFRTKLLASHVGLVAVVGAIALVSLERGLSSDLVGQLDQRLEEQARGAVEWAHEGGRRHPEKVAKRIASIVDAEVTLFDAEGAVLGASSDEAHGDVGEEVATARRDGIGRASRRRSGRELHLVAVKSPEGVVVRLGAPLSEIEGTVAAMRRRLLFASSVAIAIAIALGVLASRLASRPLSAMTRTAARLAEGDFDVPIPEGEADEFGVLWRSLASLAQQLKARIESLKKLASMRRDFVANVSHELRTPVSAIQGYAETLLDGKTDPETSRQFLEIVHRQAVRLGSLVEQLLALSEIEGRDRTAASERVVVADLAERVAEAVRGRSRGTAVTLGIEVPADLALVADPDALERALLNVVDNAVKYGREGGRVQVRAEPAGEQIRITVTDDGPGIAPEHLPRLFERFYRVDEGRSRKQGGAGLGLAIVKHLVESMHGTVGVESTPGEGTTFTITVPAAPA